MRQGAPSGHEKKKKDESKETVKAGFEQEITKLEEEVEAKMYQFETDAAISDQLMEIKGYIKDARKSYQEETLHI